MPIEKILEEKETWVQEEIEKLEEAKKLGELVDKAWKIGKNLAVLLLEKELARREKLETKWRKCSYCGEKIENKGKRKRQILTSLGVIRFKRKVGWCPNLCQKEIPLDKELDISRHQRASLELQKQSCLLAMFVSYEQAANLLTRLVGVKICSQTVWNWAQDSGYKAWEMNFREVESGRIYKEKLDKKTAKLPLVVGADGVMVPFRPETNSAKGKTKWKEVKIGIFARLKKSKNKKGKKTSRAIHKRFVASFCGKSEFRHRMAVESRKHDFIRAKSTLWISDGAKDLWSIYEDFFWHKCQGILDYYHLIQNLSKATKIAFDGRTKKAKIWFRKIRRLFFSGKYESALQLVGEQMKECEQYSNTYNALLGFISYVEPHKDHIDYRSYKKQGLPIGSGIVESACKYLIQQRFKGVGMRWSNTGFDNLLHLRLAWFNGRFDLLFEYQFHSLRNYPP